MPILHGAVAYQTGEDQFEAEKRSWDLAEHSAVVRCPNECLIQYDLYTEINAGEDRVKEYIALIRKQLKDECPDHRDRIRINREG
jgi:hypothetical protein